MTTRNPNQPIPLSQEQHAILHRAAISDAKLDYEALAEQLGMNVRVVRRRVAGEHAKLSRRATNGPVREGDVIVYARHRTDDYRCDVHCELDAEGVFHITVASERVFMPSSLPPPAPEHDTAAQLRRLLHIERMALDAPRHSISRGCDGQVFLEPSADACVLRMEWLITQGYRVPEGVLEDLRAQRRNVPTPVSTEPPLKPGVTAGRPVDVARLWTEEEDQRLAASYPDGGVRGAHAELPDRTASAIAARALALGLRVRSRKRIWTHAQEETIAQLARSAPRTPLEVVREYSMHWRVPPRELQKAIYFERHRLRAEASPD
jgi:hypothetical protein